MLQQTEVCDMVTYSSWIIVSQCSLSMLYWWRGFGFNTDSVKTDSKTALKPASPAWCNEMTYGVFWYINHYGGGSTKNEEISTYTSPFQKAPNQMKICMLSPHLSCWRCFGFLKMQFPVQCSHPHQHLRLGFTVALPNQLKCRIPKHHK